MYSPLNQLRQSERYQFEELNIFFKKLFYMNRAWFHVRVPFANYPEMYQLMKEIKPSMDKLHGILIGYEQAIELERQNKVHQGE